MRPIGVDDLAGRLGRWSAGRGSLYLLLAARLRELVDEGLLPAGTLLPPDRALAAALAVGRTTVVAAYDVLRQEGRLTRRRGSGTWVSAGGAAAARAETANPMFVNLLEPEDGVLQFACAGPASPPPRLVAAYQRAMARLPADDLGYHPLGHPRLRAALAARYRALGVPTTPDQVLVTTGGQQALALVVRALLRPGDEVLVEAPTYPGVLDLLREAAAVVRAERDLTAAPVGRPALVYAMPSFRNPTGTSMSALERQRLVRVAGGVPLLFDEVLSDLDFDAGPPRPPEAAAITVASLSKVVWGGLRVGWVRADAALIARLARFKAVHDLGGAVLDQLAAAELVADYADVRAERVAALRAQHDHLCARLRRDLPEWEFAPAAGGQTLWVRLPGVDAASYAQVALRHGVAVLPGGSLDPTGGSGDRLRLPFSAAVEVVDAAVDRMVAAWRRFSAGTTASPVVPSLVV
ncbi:DNA-binding transcriptional MocR family regulator [Saccharothrix coeruleofusca]|uniref:aminotransferase-like domain-containing protein n=1 Tax=Saccharothrix coeruleofusca TaxID=33919 RepID=UPI001AE7D05A|nr:PLP-dependent aminotransferase family protein [Saccharothrix coeruleofusca]MBP2336595.1 DNA-binding transcriptional MocR family regulator [Saccharothrix coeruleofusca]